MNKSQRKQEQEEAVKEATRLAAQFLGRLGGMAGRGAAKARPSEVCRAAVNKRWESYRNETPAKPKSLSGLVKKKS